VFSVATLGHLDIAITKTEENATGQKERQCFTWKQDRTGQGRAGQDRTGQCFTWKQDRTGQVRTGQGRTRQANHVETGQDRTGQDRTMLHVEFNPEGETMKQILRPMRPELRLLLHDNALHTHLLLHHAISSHYPVQRDRLCGLVVRVLGYRSGGPGSIPALPEKKK
jgi:hypothetical protein